MKRFWIEQAEFSFWAILIFCSSVFVLSEIGL